MKINSRGITFFTLLIIIAGLSTGCKKTASGDVAVIFKQQQGEPLAKVGATTLTLEELRKDFLERQGTFKGAPNMNTDKARNDYIEAQVMQEAMFQKAVTLGYFDRSDIKRDIKKIVVQKLVRDQLENAQKQFVATEQEMQDHYDKNLQLYKHDEAFRVAFVSIPFGDDKAKSKKLAALIHKDGVTNVRKGDIREFSKLAMKHSADISSAGKLSVETNETEYLEKAAFDTKFGANSFDAIKELGDGMINPLLETTSSFVIVMKSGVRSALNESFADAKSKIMKRLAFENRNKFYKQFTDDLKTEYGIQIFAEKLAGLSEGALEERLAEKEAAENDKGTGIGVVNAKEQKLEIAPRASEQNPTNAAPNAAEKK